MVSVRFPKILASSLGALGCDELLAFFFIKFILDLAVLKVKTTSLLTWSVLEGPSDESRDICEGVLRSLRGSEPRYPRDAPLTPFASPKYMVWLLARQ